MYPLKHCLVCPEKGRSEHAIKRLRSQLILVKETRLVLFATKAVRDKSEGGEMRGGRG